MIILQQRYKNKKPAIPFGHCRLLSPIYTTNYFFFLTGAFGFAAESKVLITGAAAAGGAAILLYACERLLSSWDIWKF
jgi:hypothetical protein